MAITKTEQRNAALLGPALPKTQMGTPEALCCPKRVTWDFGPQRRNANEPARQVPAQSNVHAASADLVVKFINRDMIGRNTLFETPFGMRAQCYADFTASGKPLQCVEDFVQKEVLPLYGNTHTSTSVTGLQMTSFREDARRVIAHAVNAKIDGPHPKDCVLFTGQGATSAINKLVTMLDLARLGAHKNPEKRPVVFVGPFEHHSNLLPWRESGAKVVIIPESDDGKVCIMTLAQELKSHAHRSVKIGAFSAASNLTGVLSDVDAISMVLHQHGALAFFDYATCGAYVKIDMNPEFPGAGSAGTMLSQFVYRDGIFLSGHKFIGGPGSTGLLVIKSNLTGISAAPSTPGGGTVLFVTHNDHRYLSHITEREEGGTPDILGNIRLGLAFQVKQRVGTQAILELEKMNELRVHGSLTKNENIVLLGRSELEKLPIFSFLVRFGDRFLHYNFVCALLNDLFGVQTRGGCQCAGPYAARLLGITMENLAGFKTALIDSQEVLKPGFTRVSFPFFMDANEVNYILRAIHFVANEGWKFLPQYRFDVTSGSWKHILRLTDPIALSHLREFVTLIDDRQAVGSNQHNTIGGDECLHQDEEGEPNVSITKHREENFMFAKKLAVLSMKNYPEALDLEPQIPLDTSYEPLRWFAYPQDAVNMIKCGGNPKLSVTIQGPCQPQRYAPVNETKLASSSSGSALEQQGQSQRRATKNPWGRSNSYPHDSSYDSHHLNGNRTSSKRAAMKTWVKRVFVRSHSSGSTASSMRHSRIDFSASQVTV